MHDKFEILDVIASVQRFSSAGIACLFLQEQQLVFGYIPQRYSVIFLNVSFGSRIFSNLYEQAGRSNFKALSCVLALHTVCTFQLALFLISPSCFVFMFDFFMNFDHLQNKSENGPYPIRDRLEMRAKFAIGGVDFWPVGRSVESKNEPFGFHENDRVTIWSPDWLSIGRRVQFEIRHTAREQISEHSSPSRDQRKNNSRSNVNLGKEKKRSHNGFEIIFCSLSRYGNRSYAAKIFTRNSSRAGAILIVVINLANCRCRSIADGGDFYSLNLSAGGLFF